MAKKQYEKGETVLVYDFANDCMSPATYVQSFLGEDQRVAHEVMRSSGFAFLAYDGSISKHQGYFLARGKELLDLRDPKNHLTVLCCSAEHAASLAELLNAKVGVSHA